MGFFLLRGSQMGENTVYRPRDLHQTPSLVYTRAYRASIQACGGALDGAATCVYIASMDISTLQLFIDVMRQGSFAAVARERAIDPSSVSRGIASLEDELGVRLFQRSTRQLAPTEAGLLYFQRIEALVEEMQQAGAAAGDVATQPRGILRWPPARGL